MDNTKFPMMDKERDANDFQSLTKNEDVSLLRQPMRTALTGFMEAKKAYENGTDEVRRLLLHECSLIYECNVCRNMFRSLVNFISHKRIYCKLSSEGNYRSYSDHNSSVIIQTTEQQSEPRFNKSRSMGSSPIPTKTSTRDLSKVIERLRRSDVSAETTKNRTQSQKQAEQHQPTDRHHHTEHQVQNEHDPILHLESVPTSTQAVYQTLKPPNASDSIRTEVNEVHNLLTNQNTMVGPDGKAIVSHTFFTQPTAETSTLEGMVGATSPLSTMSPTTQSNNILQQQEQLQISCEICQMPFQTEKTLNIHIQKKHTASTYVFQCPTCSLTFLQPAAVIRHLANEHKKPLKRIRKMRDSILKKRIQIGDVQVKGPSRELKRLQLDSTTKDLENANGANGLTQENGKPVSTCNFCQKTFERRAAFATHLASCSSKKSTMSKSVQVQNKIRVATKEEIHNKLQNQNKTNLAILITENQNENKNENEIKNLNEQTLPQQQQHESHHRITDYHYGYTSNQLNKVNIKQEPQDEEFNSTSTQATTGSDINEMFENLEKQTFGEGLQTVSLDLMVSTEQETPDEEIPEETTNNKEEIKENIKEELKDIKREVVEKAEDSTLPSPEVEVEKKKSKGFRTVPASKQLTCRCKICNKQFNALSNLRRHISMFHYRARRFGCNLCEYRAFRRYDIVNHLTFVHKMQGERESMAVEFVTMHDIQYSKDDVEHDIVVVNEANDTLRIQENGMKTYENKIKRKKLTTEENPEADSSVAETLTTPEITPPKIVVRRKLRKVLTQEVDSGQKRPIRNRIKPVNNDFVYDLSTLKEEPKDTTTRLALKRRNTMGIVDNKPITPPELSPIKITPYRLRTEPLIPANKESIKGFANRTYRNVVQEALAAPSTLPETPAERPMMRPRLSLPCRSDSNNAPVIEATELEVARLESTFFDDSFLEKFAKKANPSFKMKPLLALQHSPLHSILQKFENNSNKLLNPEETVSNNLQANGIANDADNCTSISSLSSLLPALEDISNPIETISEQILQQIDSSPPNGKHIMEPSSPPSTPRKRITLMQRLAENRARRRDTFLRSALEN